MTPFYRLRGRASERGVAALDGQSVRELATALRMQPFACSLPERTFAYSNTACAQQGFGRYAHVWTFTGRRSACGRLRIAGTGAEKA